jgi:hypothetical protein
MSSYESWLQRFIETHDGKAGPVHVVRDGLLHLEAAVNIPARVQELTRTIPKGKGMAGLAWERAEPVQTCNLKTDETGDVRPGARAVDALAAVALPVFAGGELRAVVGIAYGDERELGDATLGELSRQAAELPGA